MKIYLILAKLEELQEAFVLLKHASEKLERKKIKQWDYWQQPPQEKIDWIKAGFKAKEFYFIRNEQGETLGMVRILNEDLLYWGKRKDKAHYVHSLVVHEDFSGQRIGKKTIELITQKAREKHRSYLRLDCDASNPALRQYYTAQGFEQVGVKTLPLGTYNLYQLKIN